MKKKINAIHIVFNAVSFDNRVLKETQSIAKLPNTTVTILGIEEDQIFGSETLSNNLKIKRFKIWSRGLPKKLPFQIIKYLELCTKIIAYTLFKPITHIHCHDLPTLPIGALLKKIKNITLIYDAHEHETKQHQGPNTLKHTLAEFMEKTLISSADTTITVSKSISEDYASMYNIDPPKLIYNCPPYTPQTKNDHLRTTLNIPKTSTIFIYQGALNPGRNIPLLIETFANHLDTNKALVFLGFGSLENDIQEATQTYKNIFSHPRVPGNKLLPLTASADCGLVMTERWNLSFEYSMPNKLFEYLMAGLPCIVSPLTDQSHYITEEQVGIVCENFTPKALANSINTFKDTYQTNIKNTQKKYCWENQEKVLWEIYQS